MSDITAWSHAAALQRGVRCRRRDLRRGGSKWRRPPAWSRALWLAGFEGGGGISGSLGIGGGGPAAGGGASRQISSLIAPTTFALQGRTYPPGTLIFKVHENPSDLERQDWRRWRSAPARQYIATETGLGGRGRQFRQPLGGPAAPAFDCAGVGAPPTARPPARRVLFWSANMAIRSLRFARPNCRTTDLSAFTVLILPDESASQKYSDVWTKSRR